MGIKRKNMARLKQKYHSTGFFGIGVLHAKTGVNIGTLWRTAHILGASFIFTIDKKYKRQPGDVTNAWSQIPLYHYNTFDEFYNALPYSTQLIGVELTADAIPIRDFPHPKRAVYLLGSESTGLSGEALQACHQKISLPGKYSLNVAVAGSIVIYDRINKQPPHQG